MGVGAECSSESYLDLPLKNTHLLLWNILIWGGLLSITKDFALIIETSRFHLGITNTTNHDGLLRTVATSLDLHVLV